MEWSRPSAARPRDEQTSGSFNPRTGFSPPQTPLSPTVSTRSPQTAALLERIARLQERLGERGTPSKTTNWERPASLRMGDAVGAAKPPKYLAADSMPAESTSGMAGDADPGMVAAGGRPRLQTSLVGRLLADLHYKDEELQLLKSKLKQQEMEAKDVEEGTMQRDRAGGQMENGKPNRRLNFADGDGTQGNAEKDRELAETKLRCEALEYELRMGRETAVEAARRAKQEAEADKAAAIATLRGQLSRAVEEATARQDEVAILSRQLRVAGGSDTSGDTSASDLAEELQRSRAELREVRERLQLRERELQTLMAQDTRADPAAARDERGGIRDLQRRVEMQAQAINSLQLQLVDARRVAVGVAAVAEGGNHQEGADPVLRLAGAEAEANRARDQLLSCPTPQRDTDSVGELAEKARVLGEVVKVKNAQIEAMEAAVQRLRSLTTSSAAQVHNDDDADDKAITDSAAVRQREEKCVAELKRVQDEVIVLLAGLGHSSSPQQGNSGGGAPEWIDVPEENDQTLQLQAQVASLEAELAARVDEVVQLRSQLTSLRSQSGGTGGDKDSGSESEVAALRMELQALKAQLGAMKKRRDGAAPADDPADAWEPFAAKYCEEDDMVDEIDVNELTVEGKLGQGSFAGVYRGKWHRPVAVKMFKTVVNQNQIDAFSREANVLRSLNHRSICRFLGTCTNLPDLYIVMELIDGKSLHNLLHDGQPEDEGPGGPMPTSVAASSRLSLNQILGYSMQIAQAMCYLHAKNVLHRDLKPCNVLVDEYGYLKLIDFGLAFAGDCRTIPSHKVMAGTPVYLPPEVLLEQSCSTQVDVFSFGVILWEMCTAELPWRGVSCNDMITAVTQRGERPPIGKDFPPGLPELIRACWHQDPAQRPSFPAITRRLHSLGAPPTPPRPVASFETIQAM